MLAQGTGGELRAGGRVAGRIGHWRLEPNGGDGHVITAAIRPVDAFWLDQTLDVYLMVGPVHWRWRRVHLEGDTIHVADFPEVI